MATNLNSEHARSIMVASLQGSVGTGTKEGESSNGCFWYSPTSPFFLLLSEHKHCDNVATNSNSENARSRMVASLQGSVGTGTKEGESSNGCFWAAGFHHVTARSCLAHALKLMNCLVL